MTDRPVAVHHRRPRKIVDLHEANFNQPSRRARRPTGPRSPTVPLQRGCLTDHDHHSPRPPRPDVANRPSTTAGRQSCPVFPESPAGRQSTAFPRRRTNFYSPPALVRPGRGSTLTNRPQTTTSDRSGRLTRCAGVRPRLNRSFDRPPARGRRRSCLQSPLRPTVPPSRPRIPSRPPPSPARMKRDRERWGCVEKTAIAGLASRDRNN